MIVIHASCYKLHKAIESKVKGGFIMYLRHLVDG